MIIMWHYYDCNMAAVCSHATIIAALQQLKVQMEY